MKMRIFGDLVGSRLLYTKQRDLYVTGVGFYASIYRFMFVSGTNSMILRRGEVAFGEIKTEGLVSTFGS